MLPRLGLWYLQKRSLPIAKEPELAVVSGGSARVLYGHICAVIYSLKSRTPTCAIEI